MAATRFFPDVSNNEGHIINGAELRASGALCVGVKCTEGLGFNDSLYV